MFKKTLTAIIAATTLFGFNANSFAQQTDKLICDTWRHHKCVFYIAIPD